MQSKVGESISWEFDEWNVSKFGKDMPWVEKESESEWKVLKFLKDMLWDDKESGSEWKF